MDQFDPPAWGEPEFNSHLVTTIHRLRRKPIGEFTSEELRVTIGQGIGLPWLVPLALEELEGELLTAGDFHPGDLLLSVLRIAPAFWKREWEWRDRLNALVMRSSELPPELREAVREFQAHAS